MDLKNREPVRSAIEVINPNIFQLLELPDDIEEVADPHTNEEEQVKTMLSSAEDSSDASGTENVEKGSSSLQKSFDNISMVAEE